MPNKRIRVSLSFANTDDWATFISAFPGAHKSLESKFQLDAIVDDFFAALWLYKFDLLKLQKKFGLPAIRAANKKRNIRHVNLTSGAAIKAFGQHSRGPSQGCPGLLSDYIISRIGQAPGEQASRTKVTEKASRPTVDVAQKSDTTAIPSKELMPGEAPQSTLLKNPQDRESKSAHVTATPRQPDRNTAEPAPKPVTANNPLSAFVQGLTP